jgi:hypothetical protein
VDEGIALLDENHLRHTGQQAQLMCALLGGPTGMTALSPRMLADPT